MNHRAGKSPGESVGKLLASRMRRGLDLVDFALMRSLGAVSSLASLVTRAKLSRLEDYMADLRRQVETCHGNQVGLTRLAFQHVAREMGFESLPRASRGRLSGAGRRAARLVPRRKFIGPLTLETLPAEVRRDIPWNPAYSTRWTLPLFWADGKRSVLEIARLVSFETGETMEVEALLEYFNFLAEHGLIDLVQVRKKKGG